jgi:SAM-dependent methyltransferase
MKTNEYFKTGGFVHYHVEGMDAQRPEDVYELSFMTPELFGGAVTRPAILDIACGAGQAVELFATLFPNFRYCGFDFSPAMLEEARRRHPRLPFLCFEFVDSLPFKDAAFDVVYINNFMEHVERPYALLSEGLRVSRKFLIFNFRACRLLQDVVLNKFSHDIRYNLLSVKQLFAYLGSHAGTGLNVQMCVVRDQPYYPSVYRCPANPNWVRDLDAGGGAKKIDALIEKTSTGKVTVIDRTVAPGYKGFVGGSSRWASLAGFARRRILRRILRGPLGALASRVRRTG